MPYPNNQQAQSPQVSNWYPNAGGMPSSMVQYPPQYQNGSAWNYPPIQQPQQQFYTPPLSGRIIQRADEIRPNEVPMDGNLSVFVMADKSSIILKYWTAEGTLQAIPFIPNVASEELTVPDLNDEILKRLDNIEKMLNRPSNPNNYRKPYQRNNQRRNDHEQHASAVRNESSQQ